LAYAVGPSRRPLARLLLLGATRTVLILLEKTPPRLRNNLAEQLVDLLPHVSASAAVQYLHRLSDFGVPITGQRRQILAWHYAQAGYYNEASDICREVLCRFPDYVYAAYTLAYCQTRLERDAEAEAALHEVFRIQPNHSRALTLKAWLMMKRGQIADAIAILEPLSARKPKRQEIWRNLAWCYLQVGRFQEAERAYARTSSLGELDAVTWTHFGRTRAELGNTRAAADCFKKASLLDPNLATPHQCLAELYKKSGHDIEAELELGKVKLLQLPPA
jgi:tetratricopeptide (TPR) repeat protein